MWQWGWEEPECCRCVPLCSLRATFDNPEYEKLVSYWIGEKYTLRYTGGMVPDVFQIIVKEKVGPGPPPLCSVCLRNPNCRWQPYCHLAFCWPPPSRSTLTSCYCHLSWC